MLVKSAFCARSSVLLIGLVVPAAAGGAGQGSVGATSSGSVEIRASVRPQAMVSNVGDLEFVVDDPARPPRFSRELCLASNSLTRSFTISAAGHGPEGTLELSDGERTAGYSIEWSSPAAPGQVSPRSAGTGAVSLGAASVGTGCGDGSGAVRLTAALDQIPLESYSLRDRPLTGVLLLTVAPQ